MAFIPAILVGGSLVMPVADRPPVVNFEQTCRQAASAELRINDKYEVCAADEKRARDQLSRQWGSFDATARARCARMATGHGSSYVELLTCLELDQSARKGPDGNKSLIISAPETPVREGGVVAVPNPPGPVGQPPAQPAAAAAPPAVLRQPPIQPTVSAPAPSAAVRQPPLQPAAAAPPLATAPPAPGQPAVAEPPPAAPQNELVQSLCRSPWGLIMPSCR